MANVTVADLSNGKGPVSARSLNAIATLGAIENHRIRISASGEEAKLVLAALKVLIEDNFGEPPADSILEEKPSANSEMTLGNGALQAVPISEGLRSRAAFQISGLPSTHPDPFGSKP